MGRPDAVAVEEHDAQTAPRQRHPGDEAEAPTRDYHIEAVVGRVWRKRSRRGDVGERLGTLGPAVEGDPLLFQRGDGPKCAVAIGHGAEGLNCFWVAKSEVGLISGLATVEDTNGRAKSRSEWAAFG